MERMLVEPAGGTPYPVTLGDGALAGLAAALPGDCSAVAVIADSNLSRLYAPRVVAALGDRRRVSCHLFPAGEPSKTRATKERLEDELLSRNLDRGAVVIALGGGVTMDLAGFVASTLLRGVRWLALPTSLLAAVDASVGGKVGVDTPRGKNLIGAFHHPLAVIIDVGLMATLPPEEMDNGLAEMAKHGIIADAAYLATLVSAAPALRQRDSGATTAAIRGSVAIKARVVAEDPEERGLRAQLNFGHTIGHGLERASDFSLSHGRAVAIGMVAESALAVRLGLLAPAARGTLCAALVALGLPTVLPPGLSPEAVLGAAVADKKGKGGIPRFALPAAVGRMAAGDDGWLHEAPETMVRSVLEELTPCSV